MIKKIASALVVVFFTAALAYAGNTTLFSSTLGDIVFPFTPPAPVTSTPGTIDNMVIGATTPQPATFSSVTNTNPTPNVQGPPNAQTVSATLTAANMQTGIITVLNGAAGSSALTLPLATAMDTAFPNSVAGSAFIFSVVNISAVAAETAVMTTNTGWTLVGGMTVLSTNTAGANSSVRFMARKTGAGAWTLYRFG